MSFHLSHILWIGGLFLVLVLSGFKLKKASEPRPIVLLTLHKLSAVAVVVLLVLCIVKTNRTASLDPITWICFILTASFFLFAIVSGGMLSTDKAMPSILVSAHKFVSLFALVGTCVVEYLLHKSW